jgi:hypothetical protein
VGLKSGQSGYLSGGRATRDEIISHGVSRRFLARSVSTGRKLSLPIVTFARQPDRCAVVGQRHAFCQR